MTINYNTRILTQAHLLIKGDVIGVGFRAWTKIQAKIHRVNGWARNVFDRPDVFGPGGGVEVVVQADENRVGEMIELLKKGPPVARVDDVEIAFQDPKEIMEGFVIIK
ncbi:acylphosphatase [Candidatus Roizmanbacteria bacterium]|nr:acylphosphatase [Candidatus Roizmanbacteria bacterium]